MCFAFTSFGYCMASMCTSVVLYVYFVSVYSLVYSCRYESMQVQLNKGIENIHMCANEAVKLFNPK